ncbi:MAG: response regulator, partial [Arcobacteraceae bacterium]
MSTKKIIIIDDETEILNMLSRFLNKSGKYSVATFSNPVVAIDNLKREKYDLVLLDIMMP